MMQIDFNCEDPQHYYITLCMLHATQGLVWYMVQTIHIGTYSQMTYAVG